MFKTREDLESHHSLESHTSANISLPAESSTGTSSRTDNVPHPPGEISELEVAVAGTGAPTSSVSLNVQSKKPLISNGKAKSCEDRAGLATDVAETSARAPRKGQRQTKSKSRATIQGSAAQGADMAPEDPADDFVFFEEERISSPTQLPEAAGSEGSENRDVQSVGAAAACEAPTALSTALDLSVAGMRTGTGSGTGTGSHSTAESANQRPAVVTAISVSVESSHVTTGRPSKSSVTKDVMLSRREDQNHFDPVVSSDDGRRIKINAKSNRRKRRSEDDDDDYADEDESQCDDDAEAYDSDYSKSDSTEMETRKRGALKGYDFHCPVKDCSRSFNKVFYFILFYF
jgi:hypothetical protein